MTMPLPKMTKAHRMYLYGVLTTGAVSLVIAGLTLAVAMFVQQPAQHQLTAQDAVKNQRGPILPPQPGEPVKSTLPVTDTGLTGWVKSSDAHSIVVIPAEEERTIQITSETKIYVLHATDIDPTKRTEIDAVSIPVNMLAHITFKEGTTDTAAEIVVVKNTHD